MVELAVCGIRSDVLLQQLEGIDNSLKFDEVGTVLQVSDGVARIYGLRNAEANELLQFENGVMGTVMNLEEDNVGAVLLGPTDRIKEGMIVKRTKRIASIQVGESMLGRVIISTSSVSRSLVTSNTISIAISDKSSRNSLVPVSLSRIKDTLC